MMKRLFPAGLVSALMLATPVLASPGSIAATRNGQPVQLRAEYVPASEFAAPTNGQFAQQTPAVAQAYQEPPVDYRDAMLAAGYAPDGSPLPAEAASYQPMPNAGANYPPPAYPQAAYQQAGYAQTGYAPGYPPAGHGGYPPPLTVVHTSQVVPVAYPVPVAYGVPIGWRGRGWNGGWNNGWNRGWHGGGYGYGRGWNRGWGGYGYGGGWNRGWGGGWGRGVVIQPGWGWGRGYHRGGGWGCRSSGAGALAGSVAGAALGYGIANPWDRGTGVIIGGVVGALAGTALERSSRCY